MKQRDNILSIVIGFILFLAILGLWTFKTYDHESNKLPGYELVEPADIFLADQNVEPKNN